jgi:prevent-host-death family protein
MIVMAQEIPVTQARAEFADLVNQVAYGGERIVVTRHGKPIAALVPAADLERLEQADAGAVIRLAGDPTSQPAQPQPVEGQRFGIAAHHRQPGGGSGSSGGRGPQAW